MVDAVAAGQAQAGVSSVDRAGFQAGAGLAHDLARLAHLAHAHHDAIKGVASGADDGLELVGLVAVVGLVLAQVAVDAAGAQAGAGPAPTDRIGGRHRIHIPGAVDEDAVLLDQAHHLVDGRIDVGDRTQDIGLEAGIGVAVHPADAGDRVGQAGAAELLPDRVDLFAAVEEVPEVGQGAEVDQVGEHAHQVVDDARQFEQDDPQGDATLGDADPEHALGRLAEADVVHHRAAVVEAVGEGQHHLVGALLDHLLETAVQIAHLADRGDDALALDRGAQAQGAVGGRVARPDIHHQEVDDLAVRTLHPHGVAS